MVKVFVSKSDEISQATGGGQFRQMVTAFGRVQFGDVQLLVRVVVIVTEHDVIDRLVTCPIITKVLSAWFKTTKIDR